MRRLTEAVRKSTRGRRSMTALWKRPWVIRGGAIIGFAMLVGAVGWIGADGRLNDAYENARVGLVDISAAAGLVTSEVFVVGREKTPRRVLIDALDVTLGAPLLSFDAEAARRRIEAIGWVREAVVERRFPDTIFLRIEERDPLALWQKNGRLFVIDNDGVVIKGASPQNYALLPVIVGDDAPANAGLLLTVLASEPSLHQRVAAAVRVGGRRWNLRFDNGDDVELPEQNFAAAWRRLAEFERIHQLLARDITAIDLRLPDRLVVRPAEAFSGWSAEGENT